MELITFPCEWLLCLLSAMIDMIYEFAKAVAVATASVTKLNFLLGVQPAGKHRVLVDPNLEIGSIDTMSGKVRVVVKQWQ